MDNRKNIETFEASSMPAETGDCITEVQDASCSKNKTAVDIQDWLVSYVAEILEIETKEIDITIPLERYGLDSSEAVVLSGDLQDWLDCDLDPELLLDYQTIEALTQYLIEEEILTANTLSPERQNRLKILPQKVDIAGNHGLSHGQKALWFLYKLAPQSHAYNVAFTARICSQVNVSALKQTFQKLNDRHPMLRVTFFEQDGEPLQRIRDRQEICFEEFDASAWSPDELKQQVTIAYQRPFDLEQGPILRVSLFNCSECDRVLLLSIHHIACDGWSIWLLLDELRVIYQGQIHQFESLLPSLEFSYLDYVRWQSETLASSEGERLWHYWQQQLAGELPMLNLPTDRPRPPIQNYRGDSHTFRLSKELTQKLKELGQAEGATLYMTLLAAFQVLLHRYTSQDDILVGSPMKCRNQSEWSRVFGYLVNPVVLRANLSGNPSFQAFLAQIRQTVLGAIAHQDYPFPLLIERLQPERESSRSPLFQTMFVLQKPNKSGDILDLFTADETRSRVNWGGLELESFEIPQQDGQFDLTLEMMETKDFIRGIFKYDTDLFDAATIARMEGHFQVLLEGIVANPHQCIGSLPILTSTEEHQLLVEWNDTKADYPQDKCIHQLFEEQVAKTPEAIAVVFEDQQLTYRKLNSRANQLAHYLQGLGVKPEVLVGICVERSVEMVIGLLGILKAGGAYVPLDPGYPKERLSYMLSDSQVPVLLTQESLLGELPEYKGNVVCLDKDWTLITQENKNNPTTDAISNNLAYIIYTSGSTGKPKGVQICHQGLCSLSQTQIKLFNLHSDSNILQFASFSFDASIWEIVMALCSGASLCLRNSESLLPGSNLIESLRKYNITHVTLPPSALAVMSPEDLPSLQTIIVAGEACSPELVTKWSQGRRFFNAYGPTESTICATMAECPNSKDKPPIGCPISNIQVYILDEHLQPVPIGVTGELHIGGIALARGYLNRPELTKEKFMLNPFDELKSSPLYKTGDLVRYLPDGNIEFLGRIDHQAKIRGFRIELGEIEIILKQNTHISKAIVIADDELSQDKCLVAYIVPCQEQDVSISNLRKFLKQKLPDYMIPTAFVILESIPLTPNGKVDHRRLPAPNKLRRETEVSFIAPTTTTEKLLATIWAEVLGLEKIGIQDNFFELGGNSLQALKLVSRLSTEMKSEISIKLLFVYPNIAELAVALDNLNQQQAEVSNLEPINNANQTETVAESAKHISSPFLQLERRSLLSLFASGKIAPVDAVALAYFPISLLEQTGLSRDDIIYDWFDNLPVVFNIMQTHWGRIALVFLPRFSNELYNDQKDLVNVIVEALELAGRLGAKNVSLTGIIPSATNYGCAIAKVISERQDLPNISTGHAGTSATVVLSIKRILTEGGRKLSRERVAFVGLGSVGLSTLRLMLKCLPHPKEIMLCDLYSKRELLEQTRHELVNNYDFQGIVKTIESRAEVPTEIYQATLIIGATNVPNIVDVNKLKPGTIIVDDSAPHCFATELAIKRFQERQDILFTEGGVLKSTHPISKLVYWPSQAEQLLGVDAVQAFLNSNSLEITGCIFSSILSSQNEQLKPTIGLVDINNAFKHYQVLSQLDFQAADLHCEGYLLTKNLIDQFRHHFANS